MNTLGSNREVMENKLIVLYLVHKINLPVSNLQITRLVLENKFMNYFLLQQFLNELCESKFLAAEVTGDQTVYTVTPAGKQTLEFFSGHIPAGIKARIDNTVATIRKSIRNETLITADFIPESENEFIVTCQVGEESFSLMEIKVTVGTKNDARMICDHWKKYSQAIYSEIIDSLTKKREPENREAK